MTPGTREKAVPKRASSRRAPDTVLDNLPIPVAVLDAGLQVRQINRAFRQMFGVAADDLPGHTLALLMKCDDVDFLHRLLGQVAGGELPQLRHEVECVLPGGHRTRLLLNAARHGNEPDTVLVALIDLGAIHHVQEVEASLREKEALLKEIHHRVKNNLQVISSLLELQGLGIQDAKALRRLKDSQERIRSMALIHEKLYKSRDLMHIDMRDYIRSLAASLAHLYGVAAGTITVDVHADDVFLGIDQAIPCGLILNELLSNVYKYAFPDRRRGHVTIGLTAEDGQLVLTVRDDGIGLPPAFDEHSAQTLGLLIVRSLTEQLRGTLSRESGGGARFTVRFPKPTEKAAA